MPTMPSKLIAPLAALALLGLAACAETLPEAHTAKAPVVTQVTSLHAVRFAPEEVRLSEAERQRLLTFLERMRLRQGDRLLVELPDYAEAGELGSQRALAVMQFLVRHDLSAEPFSLPESGAQMLRVGVERVGLNAPADCPDWASTRDFDAFVNGVHPNFGCANANNFAVMLADPRDAVEGRPLAPADAERSVRALATYRAFQNIPLDPLPTSGSDEE
jgi:pilus assembly protein CpaD